MCGDFSREHRAVPPASRGLAHPGALLPQPVQNGCGLLRKCQELEEPSPVSLTDVVIPHEPLKGWVGVPKTSGWDRKRQRRAANPPGRCGTTTPSPCTPSRQEQWRASPATSRRVDRQAGPRTTRERPPPAQKSSAVMFAWIETERNVLHQNTGGRAGNPVRRGYVTVTSAPLKRVSSGDTLGAGRGRVAPTSGSESSRIPPRLAPQRFGRSWPNYWKTRPLSTLPGSRSSSSSPSRRRWPDKLNISRNSPSDTTSSTAAPAATIRS